MADWAAVISSAIAAIALLFTGYQLLLTRRQDDERRRIATEGVSVSWQVLEAPDRPSGPGDASWLYRITIQNPGYLPIDNVVAKIRLTSAVRRIRYSGRVAEPTEVLTFRTAVLPPGGVHEWRRRLQLPLNAGAPLRNAEATVEYRDMEMQTRSATWPRIARNPTAES